MTRKSVIGASALMVLTMLGSAFAVGASLPAEVQLPIHWGLDGKPDGFSDKWTALLLPAGITFALSLLFYFLPALEPRREGLERSQGLYLWGWVAILLMGAIIQLAVVAVALGWPVDTGRLVVGGTGAMLVLIGNQLGKSRSMYLIGMRTPWTLASEDVWIRTHRLAGKLMVAAGLEPERRAYHPHITLARLPRGAGPIKALIEESGGLASPAFEVRDFRLYESRLSPEGPVYTAAALYSLA